MTPDTQQPTTAEETNEAYTKFIKNFRYKRDCVVEEGQRPVYHERDVEELIAVFESEITRLRSLTLEFHGTREWSELGSRERSIRFFHRGTRMTFNRI